MKNWDTLEADRVKLLQKHYTSGRGGNKIEMVVIHHNAGVLSIDQIWQVWQDRQASAHYQVTTTGEIGQLVWDSNTAWHAANQAINQRSIGIEFSNSAGAAQDWPISDKTIEEGAHLVAAICRYYKLGRPMVGKNVRFHREFAQTSCPHHLAPGGKYHDGLISRAQYWYDVMTGAKPPAPATTTPKQEVKPVEKVLDYKRDQVTQDTFYNCGPASTQTVIRAATGTLVSEAELGKQMGTDQQGTDWIGLIRPVLNRYIPGGGYAVMEMPNDPPTAAQKATLWERVKGSIDAGFGCVANIVAPPSNYPRASYTSNQDLAYRGGTVWHYVAVMGYAIDSHGMKHVWLADSGFPPYGSWITFDQLATLIPPKGIAFSTAKPKTPEKPPAPKPEVKPVTHNLDTVVQTAVAGSDFKDSLANFIRYADSNSFVAKNNTELILKTLERIDGRLAALEEKTK